MQINLLSKYLPKKYQQDIFHMILFGVLSLVFARIKFHLTGFEDIESNFREIPLLISLFYIRNPLYLIGLCLISALYTSVGIPSFLNSGVHIISILGVWVLYFYAYKMLKIFILRILAWAFITFIYYAFFIIPSFIIIGYSIGYLPELKFWENYFEFHKLMQIEGITTTLVTGLYLMQLEVRRVLIEHKLNLEQIVEERTKELALTNENLDQLVKDRSNKIKEQLKILVQYAHMNSHEVRAPLARILGLLQIVKLDKTISDKDNIVPKLCKSGEELDEVVKSMNRLLEKEIIPDDITGLK